MSYDPETKRPKRQPYHGPAVEITFGSRRELERYLAKHGHGVARWNADGSFDTERIERTTTAPGGP